VSARAKLFAIVATAIAAIVGLQVVSYLADQRRAKLALSVQAETIAGAAAGAIDPTLPAAASRGDTTAQSRLNAVLARAASSSPYVSQIAFLGVPSAGATGQPGTDSVGVEVSTQQARTLAAEGSLPGSRPSRVKVVTAVGDSPFFRPGDELDSVSLPLPERFTYSASAFLGNFVIAISPVDVADPSAGYVAAVLSETSIGAERRQLTILLSVAALAALGFLIAVSRTLTTRLKVLAKAAERIERGDLSTRVDISGSDEIGELAQAFNRMAEALQHNREALAKAVAELADTTAELEKQAAHNKYLLEQTVSAVDEERRRLATELHDSTIQAIQSAAMEAEYSAMLVKRGRDQEAIERLEGLRHRLTEATTELRRMLFDLRPPGLDREGLLASIRKRLEDAEALSGVSTSLQVDAGLEIPPEQEEVIYRFCQEAITNAVKHSGGSSIAVRIWKSGSTIRAEVKDDGRGFTEAPSPRPGGYHLGLENMKERARLAGGHVVVDSGPGIGTRLELVLPLRPPASASEGKSQAGPQ
jgi:signal transduction histidine kinase